jgi:hypothetical protein
MRPRNDLVTRDEHRRAYAEHKGAADLLLMEVAQSTHLLRDGVLTDKRVLEQRIAEYHDELTAASAHLALSMLLEAVDG